jgi:hypothetical protein
MNSVRAPNVLLNLTDPLLRFGRLHRHSNAALAQLQVCRTVPSRLR